MPSPVYRTNLGPPLHKAVLFLLKRIRTNGVESLAARIERFDSLINPFECQIAQIGIHLGGQVAKNEPAPVRLRPIIHHYLVELAKTGAYGKSKAGVMRRFIENGIVAALEAHVIEKQDVRAYGETLDDEDDD
jgi:hypothetical protein